MGMGGTLANNVCAPRGRLWHGQRPTTGSLTQAPTSERSSRTQPRGEVEFRRKGGGQVAESARLAVPRQGLPMRFQATVKRTNRAARTVVGTWREEGLTQAMRRAPILGTTYRTK